MDISHDWLVGFAKSFGLLYLIAMSGRGGGLCVLAVPGEALRPRGEECSTTRTAHVGKGTRSAHRHATTGHEWDGITELNTRVPRAIWWFIGITHLWALIYWI